MARFGVATERQPRKNRIDPWGDLHSVAARGMFTGNRGCLVDGSRRLVRHHHGSLWIICHTRFRGWRHPLDAPHTWTPLFFLDDAVALAAGHRPCGLCRRGDYLSYRQAVTSGLEDQQGGSLTEPILAPQLNRRLAVERLRRGRGMVRAKDRIPVSLALDALPNGAVIVEPSTGHPHLVSHDRIRPFAFDGWGQSRARPRGIVVDVITPPTSLLALIHGFEPRLHPTAAG